VAKQLIVVAFIVAISTITYIAANYFVDVAKIDKSLIQPEFYEFFVWKLGGLFFLNAVYAFLLFIYIHPKLIIIKVVLCWMFIAETFTFVMHIIDKVFRCQVYNGAQAILTLFAFSGFCTFFIRRAIYKQKSDVFIPKNTYVVSKLPTDTLSILNYIFNHSGHKSIYQDGDLYKFSKENKEVIKEVATSEFLHRKSIVFKEIHRISNPEKVLGKKFNIRKYNCNHMVKDARGTS